MTKLNEQFLDDPAVFLEYIWDGLDWVDAESLRLHIRCVVSHTASANMDLKRGDMIAASEKADEVNAYKVQTYNLIMGAVMKFVRGCEETIQGMRDDVSQADELLKALQENDDV
jgi:hypothetical protein